MTEIQPAARELAALAAVMRGWDYDETLAAIIAAKTAGWDFGQVFREVARLLVQPDGTAASLRYAARSLQGVPGVPGPRPDTYSEGAAKARELLGSAREDDGDAA